MTGRNFKKIEDTVSPVIGIILMVVILAAISRSPVAVRFADSSDRVILDTYVRSGGVNQALTQDSALF